MTTNELITLAAFAVLVLLLWSVWLYHRRRRRRVGSTAMSGVIGTFDELFHPEAAKAMEIREIQQELPADGRLSDDELEPGRTIVISLKEQKN